MKNRKILIVTAIVIALGVTAYFIFRKPSTEEIEKKSVTANTKKNRKFLIF